MELNMSTPTYIVVWTVACLAVHVETWHQHAVKFQLPCHACTGESYTDIQAFCFQGKNHNFMFFKVVSINKQQDMRKIICRKWPCNMSSKVKGFCVTLIVALLPTLCFNSHQFLAFQSMLLVPETAKSCFAFKGWPSRSQLLNHWYR